MIFNDLKGRVALVTGASRRQGIGAAICRAFAAQGTDVFFSAWRSYDRAQPHTQDPDGPERLVEELRAQHIRAEFLEIDLSASRRPNDPAGFGQDVVGTPVDPGQQRCLLHA